MAAVVNMGVLVGDAVEAATIHRLTPEATEWLIRRVHREVGRRTALHAPYTETLDIGHDMFLTIQWDWLDKQPAALRRPMETLMHASKRHVWMAEEMGDPLVWSRQLADLDLVVDWLACLPTDNPEMFRKLGRVSWDKAVTLTERWHARVAKRMSRKASAAELAEGTRAVLELPDGWRWVRLETEEALDREGEAMGHCVGEGAYDGLIHEREPDGVYSLRDAKGMPHVTVEMVKWEVRQAQGRANTVPEGHEGRLADLIQALGVALEARL